MKTLSDFFAAGSKTASDKEEPEERKSFNLLATGSDDDAAEGGTDDQSIEHYQDFAKYKQIMSKKAVDMETMKGLRHGLSKFDPSSMNPEDMYQHSQRLRDTADRSMKRSLSMPPSQRSELWEDFADIADAKSKLLKSFTKK